MKHTLPSGAVLDITLLPYEQAWEVSQCVAAVFEKIDFDFSAFKDQDIKSINVLDLKGPFLKLLSDKTIIEQAKKCWIKCKVNDLRIDSMTFEKAEMRKDFLPTVYHVIKENISPFFENLLSSLSMS